MLECENTAYLFISPLITKLINLWQHFWKVCLSQCHLTENSIYLLNSKGQFHIQILISLSLPQKLNINYPNSRHLK